MAEETKEEKARVLIACIDAALRKGTEHYSLDGVRLLTTKDVLMALRRDGEIKLNKVLEVGK